MISWAVNVTAGQVLNVISWAVNVTIDQVLNVITWTVDIRAGQILNVITGAVNFTNRPDDLSYVYEQSPKSVNCRVEMMNVYIQYTRYISPHMFTLEISNFQFPMETLGLFTEHEHK